MMPMLMMTLMVIMMTKPYDYADDTDDANDHKNNSSTVAGLLNSEVSRYSILGQARPAGPATGTS